MNPYRFQQLEMDQGAAREEYERLFYTSFLKASNNRLVHTLWAWDHDTRRLATRIGYEDQMIFGARDGTGRLESAIAFNVLLKDFQSLAFGFPPPRDSTGCFEVLTFFSRNSSLQLQLHLWSHCLGQMTVRGFHTAFATTAHRPLKSYVRIGWKAIGRGLVNGEERSFLSYDLNTRPK